VAYRAAYIDEPYALVPRTLRGALWPAGDANRHDVLGDPDMLGRASVDTVRAFVRERIQPARATLVIAGRVTAQQAGDLAQHYFQWIPQRAVGHAASATVEPLTTPVHLNVRDPLTQIVVGYRVRPASDPRTAVDQQVALEVLARVIAESPGSPMTALVDGKRATDVRAEVVWHARGVELVVHVTPAEQLDRDGVEALADLVRLAVSSPGETPPSDELVAHLGAAWLTEHLLSLETISGRAATYPEWASYSSIDEYVRALQTRVRALRSQDIAKLARLVTAPSSAVTVVGLPEGR
jgi:predicted Zn-dependent peptidase